MDFLKRTANNWANLSLRLKGLLIAWLPAAALVAAVILLNRIEHGPDEASQVTEQLQELRAAGQNLYIVLIAAESAVRNYALTGHEDGLEPLTLVSSSLDTNFDKVRDLIRDDPQEFGKLQDLRRLAHDRLAGLFRLRNYYEMHRGDDTPPPADLLAQARVSPDVFVAVNQFGAEEARAALARTKAAETRQLRVRVALGAAIAIALVGGLLAVFLFTGGIISRIRVLESGASQLEKGLPPGPIVRSHDELGRLSMAMEEAGAMLAARDRELRLALETAQLLVWEMKVATRQIRYRAGSAAEESIMPVELLVPTADGWIATIHPLDRDAVRSELDRVLASGEILKLEYRVVISGGEVRWMTVRAQRQPAGDGAEERLLGILADITERRHAAAEIERQAEEVIKSKQALEQQTRILQSILDSMGDGVVVTDTQGKFLVFNPAAEQILGRGTLGGDPSRWPKQYGLFREDQVTLYDPDHLPFVRAIHGESVDGAEIFVKAAGAAEGIWVSVTARPLRRDTGEIRGGVMVIRDVTAARRSAEALDNARQEAETANHAKSEFLSRMSHELRTPLNSILGFAQLLELADLPEEDRDNLRHILKGGYHLLDLINEILDLARIEAGRLNLSPEPVRMREALRDALDLVRPLAGERNIHISPEIAIRCDRHVRADRQRLKQVLLNLLSNAIKFNREGGSVILSCEETPEKKLRIEVADSGSGISPEGLKAIFRPFERLAADQSEVGGTGLGLALSKRLIEAMGGTIGVESTLGLGSKFHIELDLLSDPSEWLEKNMGVIEAAAPSGDECRGTILYIEDNLSNLRLIERIMAHSPQVRLITAMQGKLGLDLAQIHVPDWILLDLHLPDISGEEVLVRLLQNPQTRNIPVTVLSADATRHQIQRLLSVGARDYLTKPLDVRQLLRLLDQTLRQPDQPEAASAGVQRSHAERNHSE